MPIPKKEKMVGNEFRSTIINDPVNWLRIPMYERIFSCLRNHLEREDIEGKTAIELGGTEGTIARMLESLGCQVKVAQDYPAIDVEALPYPPDSIDIVVLDQVLEHVRHPWKAIDEINRVLRRGGVAICTSVFIYPIHHGANYGDYYRFSPDGFRALFEHFRILSAEGWGNAQTLRIAYNHSERGPEGPFPLAKIDAERMGLYDYTDEMNYLMTWCVAQKE